jgi:coenzyme F420-reducing hydrogenase beta subunit
MKRNILQTTVDNGLCIGCGFCAASCPKNAISLVFDRFRRYVPVVREKDCDECTFCISICPNSPVTLADYASKASMEGTDFGLRGSLGAFLCYDFDPDKRIKSTSGGIVTAFLSHLLETGKVDGVIAADSREARYGERFHEIAIFGTVGELENSRRSKYYPLTYADILKKLLASRGSYALVGLPCTMRAVRRLPDSVRSRLKFTVSLFCHHNVTGQFLEYHARRQKIPSSEPFSANLRDKVGAPDASRFNSSFTTGGGTIRKSGYALYLDLWTSFLFGQEACLYCPDAYGAEADISAKDAWGSPCVSDPLGCSYILVRDRNTLEVLEGLRERGRIHLEPVSLDEIKSSQKGAVRFKHIHIKHRMMFKKDLRTALRNKGYRYKKKDFLALRPVLRYLALLSNLKVSRWQFALFPSLSLHWLVALSRWFRKTSEKSR